MEFCILPQSYDEPGEASFWGQPLDVSQVFPANRMPFATVVLAFTGPFVSRIVIG